MDVEQIKKEQFPVIGMTCAACAGSVESMLSNTEGVNLATVNFAAESVLVEYNQQITSPEKLKEVLKGIGYDLDLREATWDTLEKEKIQR